MLKEQFSHKIKKIDKVEIIGNNKVEMHYLDSNENYHVKEFEVSANTDPVELVKFLYSLKDTNQLEIIQQGNTFYCK